MEERLKAIIDHERVSTRLKAFDQRPVNVPIPQRKTTETIPDKRYNPITGKTVTIGGQKFSAADLDSPYFMNDIPGQRKLDQNSFGRIISVIRKLRNTGTVLSRLVNEVVYEIRFGRLSGLSYKTNQIMTPFHATNIALKEIKKYTWKTPGAYKLNEAFI